MQARDKAGSLEIVNKVLPHDDEFPELTEELSDEDDARPGSGVSLRDEEVVGTGDAEELTLAEIDDGPESIGLDVETGTGDRSDGFSDGTAELQDSDEGEAGSWTLDEAGIEAGIEVDAELSLDEAEDGWTEESEGAQGVWDDGLGLEDDEAVEDDGGLEGVEDALLDELGLEDAEPARGRDDDEDDDDEAEEEFFEELPLIPHFPIGRE